MADLDTGNMRAALGSATGADQSYQRAQEAALRSGRRRVAAAAVFRRAWLALGQNNYGRAERLGVEAVSIAGPDDDAIADLTRILAIRIAFARGDDDSVERQLGQFQATARPLSVLVTAPRIGPLGPPSPATRAEVGAIRFIDLGFWIRPDGRTADAEVLRSDGDPAWFRPVLEQVAERRYAPFLAEPGDPGSYQIERYTLRPSYGVATGTRIAQRIGDYSLHVADLTHMSEEMAQAAASPLR